MEGMGHNSVLRDGGEYYIVYHGRDIGNLPEDYRCARIDEMKVEGDALMVQITH